MLAKRTALRPSEGSDAPPSGNEQKVEHALLVRVAARDIKAYRELVAVLLPMVNGIARRMLGNAEDAQDVAQDAMIKLWESAGALRDGGTGAGAWLRRVTTNLCIDRLRTRNRLEYRADLPEQVDEAKQLDGLLAQDLTARVREALDGLPDRQRVALTLFHFEGHSQLEIGAMLDVSDEAVESLLARARRKLRQALEDDWRQLLKQED